MMSQSIQEIPPLSPGPLVADYLHQLQIWWFICLLNRETTGRELQEYLAHLIEGEGPPEMVTLMKEAREEEYRSYHEYIRDILGDIKVPHPRLWTWQISVRQICHFKHLLLLQGYNMEEDRYFDRDTFTYTIPGV